MNLAVYGIFLNGIGSAVLVFTPLTTAYGGPVHPLKPSQWKIGWSLMLLGYVLQAVAAYHR